MRICFIGDELVAGVGDPRGLGWVGRVNAHSTFDLPATFLTLAVPSETTKQMAARWEAEVLPRLADGEPHGLVIGVGPGDVAAGISTARSRLNLANITDRATSLGIPSFVVGPPPLAGRRLRVPEGAGLLVLRSVRAPRHPLRRLLHAAGRPRPVVRGHGGLHGARRGRANPARPGRLRPHGVDRPASGLVRVDGRDPHGRVSTPRLPCAHRRRARRS